MPTPEQLGKLRDRLTTIIELAVYGDERARSSCAERLAHELSDWTHEINGRTTLSTLTPDQIQRLRLQMPWRTIVFDAALDGNPQARRQCVEWISDQEEENARGSLQHGRFR